MKRCQCGNEARPNQRTCKQCHNAYMRKWRKRRARREVIMEPWQHKKTGNVYYVERMDAINKSGKAEYWTVYMDKTGLWYVRRTEEFLAKFERIEHKPMHSLDGETESQG